MKRLILILFFAISATFNSEANVGGVIENPALVGGPITYDTVDISISNEKLIITARKENEGFVGSFSSEYTLISDTTGKAVQTISGIFYGLRSYDISIFYGDSQINCYFDTTKLSNLDSLFKVAVSHKRHFPANWFNFDEMNRTGFSFRFDPKHPKELYVKGKLRPSYAIYWGLAELGSWVRFKHPWANDNAKPRSVNFEYSLEPISSWKSIGNIDITFKCP